MSREERAMRIEVTVPLDGQVGCNCHPAENRPTRVTLHLGTHQAAVATVLCAEGFTTLMVRMRGLRSKHKGGLL